MMRGRSFALFLALSLMANAFSLPPGATFRRSRDLSDNQVDTENIPLDAEDDATKINKNSLLIDDAKAVTSSTDDDDDDFDDDFSTSTTTSGGGSNILSLLNIATALLPSLSGNNVQKNNEFVKKTIREIIVRYQAQKAKQKQKREVNSGDNEIDIDYATELKPPFFQRQESEEDNSGSDSSSEEDNGAEESVEETNDGNGESNSKQDAASNASTGDGGSDASDDNDSDYDEPPGGEGGGGILGLLAGLSGDGESDLGSLLAAVGGIVANLSGDGIDINALISTGLGLFVGLLSDEGSNPGEIIASYILTSLETITGGGAQNNGAFFGKFLSTLIKGTSAAGDGDSSSEENGGMKMADSGGFIASLLMGLLGEMSKHSSGSDWQ